MKRIPRTGVALTGLAIAALASTSAVANPIKADHVEVALLQRQVSIQAGAPLELGVHFKLEKGWHIYWQNPGDSGEPPRVRWDLPDGFSANHLQWPAPHAITSGPLVNYGYEDEVLLPVTVDVDEVLPGVSPGDKVTLRAHVGWLICAENCIPGNADLSLTLPFAPAEAAHHPEHEARFANAGAQLPVAISARVTHEGDHLRVDAPITIPGRAADKGAGSLRVAYTLFPIDAQAVDPGGKQAIEEGESGISIRAPRDTTRTKPLTTLAGVIVARGSDGTRKAFAFAGPVEAGVGPRETPPVVGTKATSVPPAAPPVGGLAWALLLAFLGGVFLNLMPCVFPVLSLKVFGFCEHAHDRKVLRQHGWAYTAGVLVSFWLLAGLLLIVRAGSQSLGWGFQLQSPVFIAVLALFIFLFGLNLLGTFEIGLALTRLGNLGGQTRGLTGSFVTGVLATVVATPCTAPLMGTAIGWALVQPPLTSMVVFTSLGFGMAAPYLGLSYFPALLARLPKPGRWMETLRQAMSFPLFATVIWLLAVFAQLTASIAVFELLGGLLVVALGAWLFGRYQTSASQPRLVWVLAALMLVGGTTLGLHASAQMAAPTPMLAHQGGMWQPWSPQRLQALRDEGKPVFVNFTAAWCISCKANEMMVFSSDEVRGAFADRGITTLKADWTHQDQTIATELAAHGRAGVPLYLYYPAGSSDAPHTLPSVLTPGIVLSYLDR